MARTVVLTDDLDNSPDASSVRFSVGDEMWEIDLSPDNQAKLRKAVDRFATKARPIYRRSQAPSSNGLDTAAVRAWATKEGYEVSPKGRIPTELVELYTAAHAG